MSNSSVDERPDVTIKQRIDNMNNATSIAEKVAIAKDLLIKTNIVKTESVLCQFDDDKWYSEKLLKKYLEYKVLLPQYIMAWIVMLVFSV